MARYLLTSKMIAPYGSIHAQLLCLVFVYVIVTRSIPMMEDLTKQLKKGVNVQNHGEGENEEDSQKDGRMDTELDKSSHLRDRRTSPGLVVVYAAERCE